MRELDPLRRLVELIALLDLLARSRDATELSTAGFVPSLRVEDRQRIDRVYRFVNDHFARQFGLEEAAGLVHMSPSTFSRFLSSHQRQAFYGLCERAADRFGLPAVDRDRSGYFADCARSRLWQFVEFQSPVSGAEEDAPSRLSAAFSAQGWRLAGPDGANGKWGDERNDIPIDGYFGADTVHELPSGDFFLEPADRVPQAVGGLVEFAN